MEEIAETIKQPQKSSFWNDYSFPIVFGFCSPMFREFLPQILAWILAGIFASFVSYFTLPKPRVGIIKYLAVIQVGLFIVFLAIWFVPLKLQNIIPTFWSYFLLILFLGNALYFVPPLDGNRREMVWWKWSFGSMVLAVIFSYILSL